MESPMKQAAKLLQNKKGGYRKLAVFLCLALLVTAGTVTAFVLHGQAQEHTRRVLQCTAVHQHTEDCYPEGDPNAEPVCGLADFVVHTHNDLCYNEQGELVCTIEELEAHTHSEADGCYTRPLICGLEEVAAHAHTADCYAEDDKELVCGEVEREPVEAVEGHTHTDACYEIPLICGEEERPAVEAVAAVEGDPGHHHSEDCYNENGELVCGEEERDPVEPVAAVEGDPGHTHTDACYGEPVLICGKEEAEPVEGDPGHIHTAECYTIKEGALPACGLEETEGHAHTDACYGEPELTCKKPEIELHTHTDECYETRTVTVDGEEVEEKVLICGKLQIEEHAHTEEGCFIIETLTPEEVEQLETETKQPDVVELQQVYEDENIRVIVDYDSTALLPEDAAVQLVSADTPQPVLDVSQMVVPEAPAEPAESEPAESEPAEGEPAEGEPAESEPAASEPAGSEPTESAPAEPAPSAAPETPAEPAQPETPAAPAEPAQPADPAAPETPAAPAEPADPAAPETPAQPETPADGALVRAGFVAADGREWLPASTVTYTVQYLLEGQPAGEPVQYTFTPGSELPSFAAAIARFTQTVETDEFVVTATYTALANLPADAQLRASMITGQEELDQYTAQYREAVSSDKAQMQALLDIGFWVGEGEEAAEVQPAAPVAITVQLLGEDGLPAGAPLMVVHFGENGAEVIESKADEEGAAAFKMNSFSPVGIGQVPESDEEGRALLGEGNGTFEWTDPNGLYHVTFKVNGVIAPKTEEPAEGEPAGEPEGEEGEEGEGETPAPEGEGEPAGETEGEEGGEGETPAPEGETPDAIDTANIPLATASLLSFTVETVGEEDEAYAAYAQAAQQDAGELLNLAVMRYSLTYGGVEMDLSNCEVEVIIAPTMQMQAMAAEYMQENLLDNGDTDGDGYVETADGSGYLPAPEVEASPLFGIITPNVDGEQPLVSQGMIPLDGVSAVASPRRAQPSAEGGTVLTIENQEPASGPEVSGTQTEEAERKGEVLEVSTQEVTVTLPPMRQAAPAYANTFGARTNNEFDPSYTVQYYAYLTVLAKSGANALPVIDTSSGASDGSGGKMPKNGQGEAKSPNDNSIRNMYVDASGNVLTNTVLTEVYKQGADAPNTPDADKEWTYYRKPGKEYANTLINNDGYILKEIWVLKTPGQEKSIDKQYWTIYGNPAEGERISLDHVHFTNRDLPQNEIPAGEKYIRITEGTVLRFVYETNKTPRPDFPAMFYDYDITDGKIYVNEDDASARTNPKNTSTQNISTTYFVNTRSQGINTPGNYTGTGTRLAFGNANAGTQLNALVWDGNRLNMANTAAKGSQKDTYKGCTFGLAPSMLPNSFDTNDKGYLTNGTIQYAQDIDAPKLFNESGKQPNGKTTYEGYSLKFKQDGDTYTLISVNGTNTKNLDSFFHPQYTSTSIHYHIWTNNFWPMDSANRSYGKDGHDLKFGSYANRTKTKAAGYGNMPVSDDGEYHNSYFGMRYEVAFELDENYVGPLEYYFYGDDDMWVFLSWEDENGRHSKLVCDLGGVHSTVGEYVDLWDSIPGRQQNHKTQKYTLSFFYTERGASGSTCWMQFTLPSVSTITPTEELEKRGFLKVSKELMRSVNGEEPTTAGADNGEEFKFELKIAVNGVAVRDDFPYTKYDKNGNIIKRDIAIWNGAEFTLKDGEYIVVERLPEGAVCTVTELNGHYQDGTVEPSVYNYTVTVSVDGEPAQTQNSATATIPEGAETEIAFSNTYSVYILPKTGGMPSIAYTGAGAVLVMLAAAAYAQRRRKKTADTSAK